MNAIRRVLYSFTVIKPIDWKLLVFLVLLFHVKLIVKLAAIIFIYLFHPNFRFGFALRNSRLPLFYPLVILLAIANCIIYQQFLKVNYLAVLSTGLALWCISILAIHQIKLKVDQLDSKVIKQTLVVFFLLNAGVSAFQFFRIVLETGAFNPFRYQGEYQKYFISTGDYIKGLSFDTSTTNAVINAAGIVFFLWKRSWAMVFLCTCTLLLTASNLVNLLLYTLLALLFLFRTSKEQKSMIVVCFTLLVTFVAKVSPQNSQYATEVFEKLFPSIKESRQASTIPIDLRQLPDSVLTLDQRREKTAILYLDSQRRVMYARLTSNQQTSPGIAYREGNKKPQLPTPNIHSATFQNRNDTNLVRKELLDFRSARNDIKAMEGNFVANHLPGKAQAFLQTAQFFQQNPGFLLTGAGLGNFSSKMAFKATSLQFAGGFPQQFSYINKNFSVNHLALYLDFFSAPAKKHSITNSPNSVYNQITGEYGMIGLAGLFVFYIGFFTRQLSKRSYAFPLLFLLLSFFLIDYWFEQLSVVVLFELLFFLSIKEKEQSL